MNRLQAIKRDDSQARRELRQRIELASRPRLDVGLRRLDEVAAAVAANRGDRAQFISDPTGYLRGQALPVTSCNFVTSPHRAAEQTSEVCSVFCNVVTRALTCILALVNCSVTTEFQVFVTAKVSGPIEEVARAERADLMFNSAVL